MLLNPFRTIDWILAQNRFLHKLSKEPHKRNVWNTDNTFTQSTAYTDTEHMELKE